MLVARNFDLDFPSQETRGFPSQPTKSQRETRRLAVEVLASLTQAEADDVYFEAMAVRREADADQLMKHGNRACQLADEMDRMQRDARLYALAEQHHEDPSKAEYLRGCG